MLKRTAQRNIWLAGIGLMVLSGSPRLRALLAQTSPGVSKWETEIAAFEAADKTNFPPKDAILFVGGSSIRLWQSLAHDFREHKVINRGFGGSHLTDVLLFADRIVLPYRPKMVLLYAGDNDVAEGDSPEQVFDAFKSFVEKIQAALPETQIAFISIKPSLARWQLVDKMKTANALIEDYAHKREKLMFIDVFTPMLGPGGEPRKELFMSDGLHLNAAGYELWTSVVKPYLGGKPSPARTVSPKAATHQTR